MIPADVTSRMQLAADAALQPVTPTLEITDKLSDLVPGQRLMAEIQALLPNGTYRAIINQRDVTLALPFAAKAGDSLELEVVESDGKITLAALNRPKGESRPETPTESVPTTLSRAGQLISTLLGSADKAQSGPTPTPLNGNQPIAGAPPNAAQDIIPLLKQAISQSGMFYESHQAEWVDGRFEKAALLLEPQGKLSQPTAFAMPRPIDSDTAQSTTVNNPNLPQQITPPPGKKTPGTIIDTARLTEVGTTINQNANFDSSTVKPATLPPLVSADALPLVQQQLEAFSTQHFSWQGQIWPGQNMDWKIEEEASRNKAETGSEESSNWQTHLRLTLPNLGEVDAQLRLQGMQISLVVTAGATQTKHLLHAATDGLRRQLGDAGLTLASVGIETTESNKARGQTK